jgi:serine/threonine protein kinase
MQSTENFKISFENTDILGKGRSGTFVRKGRFEGTEELAFKLIPYEYSVISSRILKNFLNRIENEARAMEAIKDIPGVVQLRYFSPDVFIQGRRYALLGQTLAENGDLFERISTRGRIEETLCRTYFQSLLNTLNCIHRRGIVHHDIKLENLFLSRDYLLEVGDWEMAGFIDEQNRGLFSDFRGTLSYMSPEMFTHKKYDGVAADIWAASVCLFTMLTGVRPFAEANHKDAYYKLFIKNNTKFWSLMEKYSNYKLPDEAKDLLNNLLEVDASKRLIAIDVILSHPWMQDTVFNPEELSSMMAIS